MKTLLILIPFIIASCGHHKNVRPGANGTHRVVVSAQSTEEGQQDALAQANHYCDKYDKHAAIEKEDSKYSGDLDEGTYKKAKMVSRLAKSAGASAWLNGGEKEAEIGDDVNQGANTLDDTLGNAYTVEMLFKCI